MGNTVADRGFTTEGYVQTSHGTAETKVVQSIDFRNWQRYYVTFDGLTYDQTVHQNTSISSVTTTAGSNITTDTNQFSWPMDFTYDFTANPDGSNVTQVTFTTNPGMQYNGPDWGTHAVAK